jgi:hypothetical protein
MEEKSAWTGLNVFRNPECLIKGAEPVTIGACRLLLLVLATMAHILNAKLQYLCRTYS